MRTKFFTTVIMALAIYSVHSQALFTRTFTASGACPTGDNSTISFTGGSTAPVTRSSTVSCNSTNNVFNSTWPAASSQDYNNYIEFTITAASGYDLTLTSLSYDRQRSGTGPQNSQIAHNHSGNFTTDYSNDASVPSSAATFTWDFTDFTVTAGNTVSFRIYGWNNTGGTLRIDNLTVNGSASASSTNSVNVSVSPSSGTETAQTNITITATSSSNVITNQTVDYAITGSGVTSSDFVGSPSLTGTIHINAGSGTGTATVQIADDILAEGDETATVTISNPTSELTIGGTPSANFTIVDNDANYYWNGGSIAANPANGGTGNWGLANGWRQPTAAGSQATWVDGKPAILAGAAGVVTLDNNYTASGINVKTTGYTITPDASTRTLTGDISIDAGLNLNLFNSSSTSNQTFNYASVISGGSGSSVTLQGAPTGSNATRLNLTTTTSDISIPVNISNSGAGIVGIVSTVIGATVSGSITNNSSTGRTMLGATSGFTLNVTGKVSGSSDIQFSAGSSGGAGDVTLSNSTNNFTGTLYFNGSTSGSVKIGAAGAIPSTTNVVMGSTNGNGQKLDLNGFDQTIASLSEGNSGGHGSITNSGSGSGINTLTINQSTNTSFGLTIDDGATRQIAIDKQGTGSLILSAVNSFSGGLKLTGGSLELGNGNILTNTMQVNFNGGDLNTGTTSVGHNETVGVLQLDNNSSITFGTGSHTLTFANSSAATWASGKTLTINNWSGVAGSTGTAGKVVFGTDNTGLTSTQLAQISFTGFAPGATILSNGEVVPASSNLIVDQTGFVSNFGTVNVGSVSGQQSFTVSGTGLPANVVITPPAGFEISQTSGTGFQTTAITLTISGGTLSTTTIYVRFAPITGTAYNTSISVASGVITQSVSVSGNGVLNILYAVATGVGENDAIWSYAPSGPASTVTALGGFSTTRDIVITSGNTVSFSAGGSAIDANNITVNSGAALMRGIVNPTINDMKYINVFGNITDNGTIGAGNTFDALGFNIEGATSTISGSGIFNAGRIRKSATTNPTSDLTVNMNVNLWFPGTDVYNNGSSAFNITINAGKTFSLKNSGSFSMDGTDGTGSGNRKGTVTVNGTLTGVAVLYALSNNTTSGSIGVIIGSGGKISADSVLVDLSGSAGYTFDVQSGGRLEVNNVLQLLGGTFAPSGTVVLKSTQPTLCAYLDDFTDPTPGTYSGQITVERYVPVAGSNQHFMSTPVSGATFANIHGSGPDGVFLQAAAGCDESHIVSGTAYGTVFQWVEDHGASCPQDNWEIRSSGTLDIGRGYSAYLTGNTAFSLTGTPNTAQSAPGYLTISGLTNSGYAPVTTLHGAIDEPGWNLVGNPFPSPIDLKIDRTGDGLNNELQVWQTSGPYTGSFQPYVIDGSTDIIIAPFQGFSVKKGGVGGTASFKFYQSERTTTNVARYFQNTSFPTLTLNCTAASNGLQDVTKVIFRYEATDTFDAKYDAHKLTGTLTRLMMYSVLPGNTLCAVNSLPSLLQTTQVPVGFKPGANGQFTISAAGLNTFDPTSYIVLEDKQLNVMQDLRSGDYTFTSNTTDNPDRFVIHFTPAAAITSTDAGCTQNGTIHIEQAGTANWSYVITHNQNLNAIANGTLNSSSPVNLTSLAPGVYQLTLTDANNYTVVKNINIQGGAMPDASFVAGAAVVEANTAVDFTANADAANTYLWNFGDGITDNNPVTSHSYATAGIYDVLLNVTNVYGCVASSTYQVNVTQATTGINNYTANNIKVYGYGKSVYVDFTNAKAGKYEVQLLNAMGQLLSTETVGDNRVVTKSFDNISAQYVVVRIKSADNTIVKKVFIGY